MVMMKSSMALIVCVAFASGVLAHALFTPAATVHTSGRPGLRDSHLQDATRQAQGAEVAFTAITRSRCSTSTT